MASQLLRSEHFEGCIFHSYHAMECTARAAVRARGEKTDFKEHGHKTAFHLLNRLYARDPFLKSFAAHIVTLCSHSDDTRSDALYPDEDTGTTPETRCSDPHDCQDYQGTTKAFCDAVKLLIS